MYYKRYASIEGGKYSSAGKSQWEGNSLWECLLLYGLIQGFSNHFIIASLLNRRLSCWHLSICSCLDHLPSPFATALHSCDILEEQRLASNLFYLTLWQFSRLRQGEGQLLTAHYYLCKNWLLWTKLKLRSLYFFFFFWFLSIDRRAQNELPLSLWHTAHLCCDCLWTATLGTVPCDILISLVYVV